MPFLVVLRARRYLTQTCHPEYMLGVEEPCQSGACPMVLFWLVIAAALVGVILGAWLYVRAARNRPSPQRSAARVALVCTVGIAYLAFACALGFTFYLAFEEGFPPPLWAALAILCICGAVALGLLRWPSLFVAWCAGGLIAGIIARWLFGVLGLVLVETGTVEFGEFGGLGAVLMFVVPQWACLLGVACGPMASLPLWRRWRNRQAPRPRTH